jgi:hypothetical protein
MRRWWKKAAERADNSNFDSHEVAVALHKAVLEDFRKDIRPELIRFLKKEFLERDGYLLPEVRTQALDSLGQEAYASPLTVVLIEYAGLEFEAGSFGNSGILKAVASACQEQIIRAARQIEEHYLRHAESTTARAINVRERLEEAQQRVPVDSVSRQVIGDEPFQPMPVAKRNGLEDGVPLK